MDTTALSKEASRKCAQLRQRRVIISYGSESDGIDKFKICRVFYQVGYLNAAQEVAR